MNYLSQIISIIFFTNFVQLLKEIILSSKINSLKTKLHKETNFTLVYINLIIDLLFQYDSSFLDKKSHRKEKINKEINTSQKKFYSKESFIELNPDLYLFLICRKLLASLLIVDNYLFR